MVIYIGNDRLFQYRKQTVGQTRPVDSSLCMFHF